MRLELVVALVLGVAAVAQATLNRHIAEKTGLAAAAVLNMLVAAASALAFAVAAGARTPASSTVGWRFDLADFRLWWLLPGVVGFAIVLGLPWVVQRTGALSAFVVLVSAQMLASALWDWCAGALPLSLPRLAGALCTVLGVYLLSRPIAP
jgi:uncharacterized membrane protein YdcZ (DUF606 family)